MIMHEPIETTTNGYIPSELNIRVGSRTLISAPTNSGKTTYAMRDTSHKYTIVLVPKRAIADNKATLDFPAYKNGKTPDFITYRGWLSTYDNVIKVPPEVLADAIVFIDEIHTIASIGFRTALPQIFAYLFAHAKTVVGMSGTLNPSVFMGTFNEVITVKSRNPKNITINNILCPPDTTKLTFALYQTIAHIDNGKKVLVMIENIKELGEFERILKLMPQFAHEHSVLMYSSKESEKTVYNQPMANRIIMGYGDGEQQIPDENLVLCNTSALQEGWDLIDPNEWAVVITGDDNNSNSLKTPENAVQYGNRLRNQHNIPIDIQRNSNEEPKRNVKTDKQLRDKVQFQRALAFEEYESKGKISPRHLCKIEDKVDFTQLPLFEVRQSNINTEFKYGGQPDYGFTSPYDIHAETHGVTTVIETEFQHEVEEQFEAYADLDEATVAVLSEAPHPFSTTEKQIEDYLEDKENSELPDSFKGFVATCGKEGVKAKDKLLQLRNLMLRYEACDVLSTLRQGVSLNQMTDHAKSFRNKGIEYYRIRSLLLEKLGTDEWHSEKEIMNALKSIPQKYFGGDYHKFITANGGTKNKKRTIKSVLGGFVNFSSKTKMTKGKRQVVYKLSQLAIAVFTVEGSKVELEFSLAWINDKTREEILGEIEHIKNRRGRPETLQGLKKQYANYVEFFDYLDEVA